MLQKTAAEEQLDDIHGSRQEKGNKKERKYKEWYLEQEKK